MPLGTARFGYHVINFSARYFQGNSHIRVVKNHCYINFLTMFLFKLGSF